MTVVSIYELAYEKNYPIQFLDDSDTILFGKGMLSSFPGMNYVVLLCIGAIKINIDCAVLLTCVDSTTIGFGETRVGVDYYPLLKSEDRCW